MREQLGLLSDVQYAESLADTIMDPDHPDHAVEVAAFRSPELAKRSLVATRYLIDHVNSTLKHPAGQSNAQRDRAAAHFRDRVGMERRLLEQIVTGLAAQTGRLDTSPNPRRRAMERLANLHYDEFRALVREEEEKRKRARQEAKARERRGG